MLGHFQWYFFFHPHQNVPGENVDLGIIQNVRKFERGNDYIFSNNFVQEGFNMSSLLALW